MEITFCELRAKEVINNCDGKKLGNPIDMVFDSCNSKITGIVVPGEKRFFHFFTPCQDIFIPYHKICKIGVDVIIVNLNPIEVQSCSKNNNPNVSNQDTNLNTNNDTNQFNNEII